MKTPSATEVNEAELAHWLFTAFESSRPIAAELGFIPEMQLVFMMDRKVLAPTARGPGDIDVLAANAAYPEQAIAVEVKRVKMPSDSYSTSLPNKLQELEKGCTQVRLLREIGFHRSYLLVAVVADGREQTEVNFAFRGSTPALVKAVKEKLRSLKFHPDVGVVVVEVTQPVDSRPCKIHLTAASKGRRYGVEADSITFALADKAWIRQARHANTAARAQKIPARPRRTIARSNQRML